MNPSTVQELAELRRERFYADCENDVPVGATTLIFIADGGDASSSFVMCSKAMSPPERRQQQDGVPPQSSAWPYIADVDVALRGVLERRVVPPDGTTLTQNSLGVSTSRALQTTTHIVWANTQ